MTDSQITFSPEPLLVEFLRTNHAACPACRRDLYGAANAKCPACNAEITLGLASKEVYRASWGTLLGVLFVDAGIGLLFAALLCRIGGGLHHSLYPAFAMFIASIPFPLSVMIFRRRFFRLSIAQQWMLAALGMFYTLVAFISFMVGLHHR